MEGTDTKQRSWRPLDLLVALLINACAWLAYIFVPEIIHGNYGSIIVTLHVIVIPIVLAGTSVGIVIVHLVLLWLRRFRVLRWCAYAIPSVGLVVVSWTFPAPPPKPNQIDNLVSPSGEYRLTMPIRNDVWRVTIYNRAGDLEYEDTESRFSAFFNVYWTWDSHDRVWLYNSDDGSVYWWAKSEGRWQKTDWARGLEREPPADIKPPKSLFPDYVKKNAEKYGSG